MTEEPDKSPSPPVALVTGASRGIGLAICEALLEHGHSVVITGRRSESIERVIANTGDDRVAGIAGNFSDPVHAAEAVRFTLERFGRLDLLVNNAGINPSFGGLAEADIDAVRKTFDSNVIGTLSFTQCAFQLWMKANGGSIVNVASTSGLKTDEGLGAYGASKAALLQMTRQLAAELAPGVRVNAVAPAVIRTDFSSLLYEGKEDEVIRRYPLGRLGRTEDVASAVVFLGTEASSWITGETLVIDGGVSVNYS